MRPHLATLACLLMLGCRQAGPLPPAAAARELRGHAPSYAVIHQAAGAEGDDPLRWREKAIAGVAIGDTATEVSRRLGDPASKRQEGELTLWVYDELPPGAHMRLYLSGDPLSVVEAQAWPPSRAETRSLVRPLDPAARVLRKYGAPPEKLAWDIGEAWLYPDENVGFVVTPEDAQGDRTVCGILVGL